MVELRGVPALASDLHLPILLLLHHEPALAEGEGSVVALGFSILDSSSKLLFSKLIVFDSIHNS